jgi:hypothetical protein
MNKIDKIFWTLSNRFWVWIATKKEDYNER